MNKIKEGIVMLYWRRLSVAIFSCLMILAMAVSMVGAQEGQGAGSGLIISPTRSELQVSPGQSSKLELTLQNVSGSDINAKVEVNDFESDGVSGEPKLLVGDDKDRANSIKNFLGGVVDVQLAKGEKKDVTIEVNVPENAAAGAYYGVIRYAAIPTNESGESEGGGRVSLSASVGSIVLIEVPGNITESITIRSLKVLRDEKASTFHTSAPNKVAIDIKNNGNGFSKPFGRITVSDMRGRDVHSYELNNTTPKANILPGSSRLFTNDIQGVSFPGRYTLKAFISHGNGGDVMQYTNSFWYVPTWLIAVLAILLIGLVVGGYVLYRRRFAGRKRRK